MWLKTRYPGVKYRESTKRNIRIKGHTRPERCFYILYKAGGKLIFEKVGLESEGVNADQARDVTAGGLATGASLLGTGSSRSGSHEEDRNRPGGSQESTGSTSSRGENPGKHCQDAETDASETGRHQA